MSYDAVDLAQYRHRPAHVRCHPISHLHMLGVRNGPEIELTPYRAQQAALIKEGKFNEAQKMDIKDVRSKFGSKYDQAIRQLVDYTKKLFQ